MRSLSIAVSALALFAIASAQTDVKGQKQLAGGTAKFGTVYSLKSGFNFEILSAHYTMDAYNAASAVTADADKKILVLDIAVKNSTQQDNFFNTEGMFTLVDDHGQLYPGGSILQESVGPKGADMTLRPGQGVGQPALKDPVHMAFAIPADAKITKIMLNVGRLNTSEDVVRYLLADPPKDLDHPTDPNFIAPLPDNVRDPSDPSGSKALTQGKGAVGTYVPSGIFNLRVDALPTDLTGQVDGADPDDGKKWISIPMTAKSMVSGDQSFFTMEGGGDFSYSLVDADGDSIKATALLKASTNEDGDKTFQLGDEYHFRVAFQVPKDAKLTRFVYGTASSRVWSIDLS